MVEQDEPRITVSLNREGVISPILRGFRRNAENVALGLAMLDCCDLPSISAVEGSNLKWTFDAPALTSDERRADFSSWIQGIAFHEMVKGVRASLEEAFCYLQVLRWPNRLAGIDAVRERAKSDRRRATEMHFPQLLSHVNAGLSAPLSFEREFSALNAVRNCLEHRRGNVTVRDTSGPDQALILELPFMKLFFEKDGQEFEVRAGVVIEENTAVKVGLGRKTWAFRVGEDVSFSAQDIFDIGAACYWFGQDLASKLPLPTPDSASSPPT